MNTVTYSFEVFKFCPHEFINLYSDLFIYFFTFLFLDQLRVVFLREILHLTTSLPHTYTSLKAISFLESLTGLFFQCFSYIVAQLYSGPVI